MPDTENEITADLIADLLREQHPDLADLPLTFGARGWDNQLWRLGDDLAVRLPRPTQDGELLLKEHTLLPAMAPHLPLQIPVPQRLGQPSERFPCPWIVTTWVAGEPADRAPATRGAEAADTLAAFLTALHQPAPWDAPAGGDPRGGPLADVGEGVADSLKEATDRGLISDPDAVREVWDDALSAPDWTGPALWLHADLHPANVLTSDGNFCGVVDFGDMRAGIQPVTWLPAGCFCPMGSSTVSIGATRQRLTKRPCAALAAGRYRRHSPACSSAITVSTAARADKQRGDRQQPQPCNASPRLEPSSRRNSLTTGKADLTVVTDSTVEAIPATGRARQIAADPPDGLGTGSAGLLAH